MDGGAAGSGVADEGHLAGVAAGAADPLAAARAGLIAAGVDPKRAEFIRELRLYGKLTDQVPYRANLRTWQYLEQVESDHPESKAWDKLTDHQKGVILAAATSIDGSLFDR